MLWHAHLSPVPDEALVTLSIEVIRLDDFLPDIFNLAPEESPQ